MTLVLKGNSNTFKCFPLSAQTMSSVYLWNTFSSPLASCPAVQRPTSPNTKLKESHSHSSADSKSVGFRRPAPELEPHHRWPTNRLRSVKVTVGQMTSPLCDPLCRSQRGFTELRKEGRTEGRKEVEEITSVGSHIKPTADTEKRGERRRR